ncbi:MAG: BlaI/MecI/CopY family transcriptional regulator [Chitinophagales bacterium]
MPDKFQDKTDLLTPLELKVMNILWKLKKACVKDILQHWQEKPRPAYNTVSTIVRILQKTEKGPYVGHEAVGRNHYYLPIISKDTYQKRLISNVLDNAFGGSASSLVSALMDNEGIDNEELNDIQDLINKSLDD